MSEQAGSAAPSAAPSATPTAQATSSTASPASTPTLPDFKGTKHKIDFDGQPVELDYDTLVGDFKKHAIENQRYRQHMPALVQLAQSLQKGDLSVLRGFVPDDSLRQFSEQQLLDYIELQSMDPRERAIREREIQLAQREAQWKSQEEAAKNAALEQERQIVNQQVQQDLVEAVKDLGGDVKVTPRLLRRIAEREYARLEAGQAPNSKESAQLEWRGIQDDYKEFLAIALRKDPSALIASLPPEFIKAIRNHELRQPFKAPEKPQTDGEDFVPPKKGMSIDETFKAMDRHYDRKRKRIS